MSEAKTYKGALPEERYKCPGGCQDKGWVAEKGPLDGPPRAPVMKPCRICQPIHVARIKSGCLRGDGLCTCSTCIGIRDGSITGADFADDGTFMRAV